MAREIVKLDFWHSLSFLLPFGSQRHYFSKETEMTGIKPGVLIVYFAWSVSHVILSGELERLNRSDVVASVELRQPYAARQSRVRAAENETI
jgi:hypothetical protein